MSKSTYYTTPPNRSYDLRKRKDRDAFRKRYPSPATGMIGNKRMHQALKDLDEADEIIAGLLELMEDLAEQQAMPDDWYKGDPAHIRATNWKNR